MHNWLHTSIIVGVEILALASVLFCVYRAQKQRIYPAFRQLLVFLIGVDCLILASLLSVGLHLLSPVHAYYLYFYAYWTSFVVQAVLILRVLHEMFRHSVRSIPGVQKMGRPIFFWGVAISVVIAVAAGVTPHGNAMSLVLAGAQVLERSQGILALCMVTFLAFASRTLGVSFRSRIFGVTFGFGIMAFGDLIYSGIFTRNAALSGYANIVHEVLYLGAIGLWAAYFVQPEPARRLVVLPASSPLMRWDSVAHSLGNPASQIPVSYPPSFMTDVVNLVNNVMGPDWPTGAAASRPPGPLAS